MWRVPVYLLTSALVSGWLTVQMAARFPQRYPAPGCGSLFLGLWMLTWGAGLLGTLLRRSAWRMSIGLLRSLPAMLVCAGLLSIALSPLSTMGFLAVYTGTVALWLAMNARRGAAENPCTAG